MKSLKLLIIILLAIASNQSLQAQSFPVASGINKVVNYYVELKNALVSDNSTLAQTKAKELLESVNAVAVDSMSAEQRKLWTQYSDPLTFDSGHISESKSLDHQREHFTSLSKNLYLVLKGFKGLSTVLYEQYCPMKKATWLSETSVIRNPYFGKQMLTCGKTLETMSPVLK